MKQKVYRLYGIDSAMELLRPKAKWEITNDRFTRWEVLEYNQILEDAGMVKNNDKLKQ